MAVIKVYYRVDLYKLGFISIGAGFDFSSKLDLRVLAERCAHQHYNEYGAWKGARTFEIYADWNSWADQRPPIATHRIQMVAPTFFAWESTKELAVAVS